jgi:DNA repair protein RadC
MPLSLNKPKLDNLAAEIWKSAERLRGKFKAYEYQNVVLPIIVIRRLECVLIKWREARRRIKPDGVCIETPADLLPHIRHYVDRKQEHLLCVSVNGANEVINIRVVSIGLVGRSPSHPREVFADALMDRASAVIIAYNHPTGSLEPFRPTSRSRNSSRPQGQ